ncbi:hypothetical protein EBR25_04560 [bacterium]|nr:hypothetical protein [bacterium]
MEVFGWIDKLRKLQRRPLRTSSDTLPRWGGDSERLRQEQLRRVLRLHVADLIATRSNEQCLPELRNSFSLSQDTVRQSVSQSTPFKKKREVASHPVLKADV